MCCMTGELTCAPPSRNDPLRDSLSPSIFLRDLGTGGGPGRRPVRRKDLSPPTQGHRGRENRIVHPATDQRIEPGRPAGRLATVVLLVVVTAVGAGLRFHRVTEIEPFIADETIYYLEAKYLYSLAETAWESLQRKAEERRTGKDLWKREVEARRFKEGLAGRPPWFARPGHLYLLLAAMAVVGPDKVYVGPLVAATAGTLCIPLLFLLGRRLYGGTVGLLAAAFFALSAVQVHYARTGLTEQDSLAFFLVALLFYVKNRQGDPQRGWPSLALAGLFLGISFVVHYRMVIFIFSAFLLEIPYWTGRRQGGRRVAARRLAVLLCCAALPLLLTELPYYLVMLFVHFFFKATLPFQTYFEQLFGQAVWLVLTYIDAASTGVRLVNFLTYPYLLWQMEGAALPAVILLAAALLLLHRRRKDGFAAVLTLVPFLLCTLFNPRTRYLCGFLPFASLLVAAAVHRLWTGEIPGPGLPRPAFRAEAAVAVASVLACSGWHAVGECRSRASYSKAIAFVEERGELKHIATFAVVSQAYVGVRNVPTEWPASEEQLRRLYEQGYRYVVMDWLKDVIDVVMRRLHLAAKKEKFRVFQRRVDLMNRIEERTKPVFTCPNKHLEEVANIFEINQDFPQTLEWYRRIQGDRKVRTIRVYDLADYFAPVEGRGP